jgi:hypothetical protein
MPELAGFYTLSPAERDESLLEAIQAQHSWHYARNAAYRATTSARGVGPQIRREQLPRLLRVSASTFKGYVEQLGTSFPQGQPARVVAWLADQVSLDLPAERAALLSPRYGSLEDLLTAIEALYADMGLEVVTSSGTSGIFTLMVRDRASVKTATDAYFTAIAHMWGIDPRYDMVFVMPARTRVAMARIADMGIRELDWSSSNTVAYTMPFSADPDTIRIRTGRTFRPGLRGRWERHVLNPFMVWASEALGEARFVRLTIEALQHSATAGRPVLLLGGLIQLDAVGRELLTTGGLELPEGSRIATGGGLKQAYVRTSDEIRADLKRALRGPGGISLPVADVYGMAEANWAAFQCSEGNYHLPPWVYVAAMDDDDHPIVGSDATGLLAFWDPLGGGNVYPPFFRTADRVRLVNANTQFDPALTCACGDLTPYLVRGSIQRIDLIEEAGCGATL